VTTPRVSVITIFLDAERFLAEAIDSVFRQTFDDWELVLVDDGSRDASGRLAEQARARGAGKVRLLEHPERGHRGMSASRNRGLASARGELVAFLDADDAWEPDKLARQVALLDSHPAAAGLTAPARYWYSWTGAVADRERDFVQRWSVPAGRVVEPPALLDMFLSDEWASLCDVLLWRDQVARLGGYEDRFAGMYEDQVFHAKLCSASSLYVDDVAVYRYRQHAESCTSRAHASGATVEARRQFLEWLDQFLAQADLDCASTRQLVAQRLAAEAGGGVPRPRWWRRLTGRRSAAPDGSR